MKQIAGQQPWTSGEQTLVGSETCYQQDNWLVFKDHLLQAQKQGTPTRNHLCKNARRPPRMDKKLLRQLSAKKVFRRWK